MPTITGSCDNSRYSLTCEYSFTQNVSANTSTITANVYLNGNGYTTSSSYWSCVINGTTVTSNKNASIGGKTLLGSRTWTVNHNSDGTCKTTIGFSYSNGLSSAGTYTTKSGSGSASVTLTTIPRGSSISLNRTSATIGSDAITLTLSRASNSYTHKVQLYFGSYSALLAENVGTSYTFTPNISLCSQIPNATSGTATIKVQTMNGSTWVAETSKTITFNVPSSVVPTIASVTATGNNLLGGIYVAGKSTVTAKINNASGAYGSTIKSYSISGANISSSASSATSGTLGAGAYTITGKVTDSRGRTASKSISITVHSYYAPSLSIDFYRCNSDGTRNDSGTYARVYINQEVQNIGNANVNAKRYKIEYKRATSTSWTTFKDWADITAYTAKWTHDLGSDWENAVTYDLKVSIKDSYNTVSATASIGTITCLFNIEQDGIGVGKVHERGALDVGGDIYTSGVVAAQNGMRTGKSLYVGSGVEHGVYAGEGSRFVALNSSGGIDVGASDKGVTLCASTNPKWWNGSTSHDIFTVGNCTITTGNGNTSYRFPNGMQINIMQTFGTWNITTAWGSVWSSPFIAPSNFIQAFATPPQVTVSAHGAGTAIMVCQAGAPTTTTPGTFYLWKPTQQTGIRDYIEIISIGRWK